MKIFNLKGEKLETVYSVDFSLESEIQKITEDNLLEVFDLELVKSEFTIQNFRVDTLAFDRKTNSFVIIEYKRSKNYSVVDQGYAYFALMLANKSDLILEYMENSNNKIKRKSINWNDSKILFVSPEFTNYQKEAINFKDLPIELWEIKRYNNNTVSYFRIGGEDRNTQLKSNRNGKRDVLEPNKVNTLNGVVTSEIVSGIEGFAKTYEEKNKNYVSKNIWNLYEKIKESILSIDNVNIENKKTILNFMANNKVFASVLFRKSSLIIFLNLKWGELSDPKQIARDVSVSNVRKSSSGDYEIKINSDDDIDYIVELIKFSYYDTMGLNDEDDFSLKEEPILINHQKDMVKSKPVIGVEGFAKNYEEKNKDYVNKNIWNLYEKIKESILSIDNIRVENKKVILNFMANKKIFANVQFRKSTLIIFLNLKWGELSDPKQIARNVSNIGHNGSGDYEIKINSDDDIDYIIELIKFSYYDKMGLNDEDDFSLKEEPILINHQKYIVNNTLEFIPSDYNLDWTTRISSDLTFSLYNEIVNKISEFGDIKIKYNKFVVALFFNKNKFSDITIKKNSIDIQLNLKIGNLNDQLLMARDVSNVGTYGTGDYMINIKDNKDMDYVIDLIKQSYLFAKNK